MQQKLFKNIIIFYLTLSFNNLTVTGSKRLYFDDEDEERESKKWYYDRDPMQNSISDEYSKIKKQEELTRETEELDDYGSEEWRGKKEHFNHKPEYVPESHKRRESYDEEDYERYRPRGFTRLPRHRRDCFPKTCGGSAQNDLKLEYTCNCPQKVREAKSEIRGCPAHPTKKIEGIKCTCSEADNVIGDLLMRVCLKFCDKLCKAKQNENSIRMQAAIESVPHDETEFNKGKRKMIHIC